MRRFLEKWFGVTTKHQAENLRRRIAIGYAILGWNCFGLLFYAIMKKKIPDDPTERRASYGKLTGAPPNMHVYQMKGLNTEIKKLYITHNDDICEEGKEIE